MQDPNQREVPETAPAGVGQTVGGGVRGTAGRS
jgi:hypothetical protein